MKKVTIGYAVIMACEVYGQIMDYCDKVEIVGSVREQKPEIDEIELLVLPKSEESLHARIIQIGARVMSNDAYETIIDYEGVQIVITKAKNETWNAALSGLKEAA